MVSPEALAASFQHLSPSLRFTPNLTAACVATAAVRVGAASDHHHSGLDGHRADSGRRSVRLLREAEADWC